jgi:hypothetical protein
MFTLSKFLLIQNLCKNAVMWSSQCPSFQKKKAGVIPLILFDQWYLFDVVHYAADIPSAA